MLKAVLIGVLVLLSLAAWLWLWLEGSLRPRTSTRTFWNLSALPLVKKIEGYVYGARPVYYLKPATWPWVLKRLSTRGESAETYHGKVVVKEDAAKIIQINHPINYTNLEHIVPFSMARDIILQHPLPSLAVTQCPCRLQKSDACQPYDVCLVVGEPFASFVVDHQPDRARRIQVEEALQILEAEEQRGHIHTAWFKDVMHNRFYCICNCCSCCCLGMQSYFRGAPRLVHSGYSPESDPDVCSKCGQCITVCPFRAITADDEDLPVWDDTKCLGCGLCASHCPMTAIGLVLRPDRGHPLDLSRLSEPWNEHYPDPPSTAAH